MTIVRKLFLLRHAKSDWDDPGLDDIDRPLSKRGRQVARRMAGFIRERGIRPALVLVSTAVRTRATWDMIEPVLEGTPAAYDETLYEA
jgi:phosphohistidine phosphatase